MSGYKGSCRCGGAGPPAFFIAVSLSNLDRKEDHFISLGTVKI